MKRTLQIASLLCLIPVAQLANAATSDGYMYDSRGVVVRTGYGGCVRTGEWAASNAIKECDPELFKEAAAAVVTKPASTATTAAGTAAATAAVTAAATDTATSKSKHIPVVVALGADESFDSSQAKLKPAAKLKLAQFVKDLRNVSYEQITITGHADHTGPEAANKSLSERRANAVHNFLVSEGLPSNKLVSSGVGSSQPRTSATDCAKLIGKKLQACLAPDRRVEISVSDIRAKQ